MLAEADVVPYLIRRDLMTERSVVDCDVEIRNLSRRNRNFAVVRDRGASYFLKQAPDPERRASIANEATIYECMRSQGKRSELNRYVPQYIGYDADEHVLVLELITGVRGFQSYHSGNRRSSTGFAASIGHALSLLHREGGTAARQCGYEVTSARPWVFSIHRPRLADLLAMSEASINVVKIVQQYPQLCNAMDQLDDEWTVSALIHADLKWENCLVSVVPGHASLKIVDWELAGFGDPLWDVGSAFCAFLAFWLSFVPVSTRMQMDECVRMAQYPLSGLQPAFQALWRSYSSGMRFDEDTEVRMLLLCARYAAARLIQTCYEEMQASSQLSGNVVAALQLSLNIFEHTEDAVLHLWGIPLPS
jgi:aminoglycoside phosphotransferase (APT) family kinase protein